LRQKLIIAEAVEPDLFVDEVHVADVVVRTIHRVEDREGGRSRVVYRIEIDGPAADRVGPELGPQISADFPEVLSALIRHAER
jgi:hypothetical protein